LIWRAGSNEDRTDEKRSQGDRCWVHTVGFSNVYALCNEDGHHLYHGHRVSWAESLFSSVLHTLNLAEMGVGVAMVYGMYKPIAEDDTPRICALLGLYRKYYRIIGAVIAISGVLLTPLLPKLISGEVPSKLDLYVLYYLNLVSTVMTYWLFAYQKSLLQAHQRTDILSIISVLTNLFQYAVQFWVLYLTRNYYLYVIVLVISTMLNNTVTAIVVRKKYPYYKVQGILPKNEIRKINQNIRDIVTGKISYVILKSADSIVISAYMGLTVLAVYQNYYFILTSVASVFEMILSSITAGLGNSIVTETEEKNYKDLEKFSFLFLWLAGVCSCCLLGMYQPFMKLWVGEDLMLDVGAVACFSLYFYSLVLNRIVNIYKDAAGIWRQDRFRPLTAAIVNLTLNLLWVRSWGVYGILLSTIVAILVVEIPWLLINLFKHLFAAARLKRFIGRLATNVGLTALAGILVMGLCKCIHGNDVIVFLRCALISAVVPNVVFFIFYRKDQTFSESAKFLKRVLKRK